MKRVVRVLKAAERALREGNDNCGGEPDNIYYDPLRKVRAEVKLLVALAPDLDLVLKWAAGEEAVPLETVQRASARLREHL